MIKYLKDLECINLERLLLLRGKELSLTDEECHILLLIDTFVTLHKKMITPSLLLKYSSLTPHEMDHILDSLLKKKYAFPADKTGLPAPFPTPRKPPAAPQSFLIPR